MSSTGVIILESSAQLIFSESLLYARPRAYGADILEQEVSIKTSKQINKIVINLTNKTSA